MTTRDIGCPYGRIDRSGNSYPLHRGDLVPLNYAKISSSFLPPDALLVRESLLDWSLRFDTDDSGTQQYRILYGKHERINL